MVPLPAIPSCLKHKAFNTDNKKALGKSVPFYRTLTYQDSGRSLFFTNSVADRQPQIVGIAVPAHDVANINAMTLGDARQRITFANAIGDAIAVVRRAPDCALLPAPTTVVLSNL